MCADTSALYCVHYALKHSTKDRRGYLAPVEITAIEQLFTHLAVEMGDLQSLLEKLSVYIFKRVKLFVKIFEAALFRRIQNLKKLLQFGGKIGAVFACSLLY